MTGLNSLTNFYCPQISSPVSHEINLSPRQINDRLFKNEWVDEAKSVQCALPSLGCISGTFPSRASPNPSQPHISPANSPDRSPAQRAENNQGLSLLLKNCKNNPAGGKKLRKMRKLSSCCWLGRRSDQQFLRALKIYQQRGGGINWPDNLKRRKEEKNDASD